MTRLIAAFACLGVLLLSACEPKPGQPAKPKTQSTAPAWR
jgi:hypothetical protein